MLKTIYHFIIDSLSCCKVSISFETYSYIVAVIRLCDINGVTKFLYSTFSLLQKNSNNRTLYVNMYHAEVKLRMINCLIIQRQTSLRVNAKYCQ